MAYDFDGVDQAFEQASTPVTAVPLTLVAWFNVDNLDVFHGILSVDDNAGSNRFSLSVRGDQTGDPVRAECQGAGTTNQSSSAAPSIGTWTHGVAKFGSNTSRFAYTNGVAGTESTAARTPSSLSHIHIGKVPTGNWANCKVAEAGIYSAELTQAEIDALVKGYSPRLIRPASLVFYAPLRRNAINLRLGALGLQGTPTVFPHPRIISPKSPILGVATGAEYLRPDADITDGGWTTNAGGFDLFSAIDEVVADDTDYIRSSLSPVNDISEVRLSNPSGGILSPFKVRYKYLKTVGQTIDLTVKLVQGTTVIATWTHNNITSSVLLATQTLTSEEEALVTDPNDLRLRFTANAP